MKAYVVFVCFITKHDYAALSRRTFFCLCHDVWNEDLRAFLDLCKFTHLWRQSITWLSSGVFETHVKTGNKIDGKKNNFYLMNFFFLQNDLKLNEVSVQNVKKDNNFDGSFPLNNQYLVVFMQRITLNTTSKWCYFLKIDKKQYYYFFAFLSNGYTVKPRNCSKMK